MLTVLSDLMLRKPRNARTDRLTNWRFFVQVYLVSIYHHTMYYSPHLSFFAVHRSHDVAVRDGYVVPVHVPAEARLLRRYPRLQQMDRRLAWLQCRPAGSLRLSGSMHLVSMPFRLLHRDLPADMNVVTLRSYLLNTATSSRFGIVAYQYCNRILSMVPDETSSYPLVWCSPP